MAHEYYLNPLSPHHPHVKVGPPLTNFYGPAHEPLMVFIRMGLVLRLMVHVDIGLKLKKQHHSNPVS